MLTPSADPAEKPKCIRCEHHQKECRKPENMDMEVELLCKALGRWIYDMSEENTVYPALIQPT